MSNYIDLKRKALNKFYEKMNAEQKKAVYAINGPVLILAGAGSGKTTVIVNRISNMIGFGNAYHSQRIPSYVNENDLEFLKDFADGKTEDINRLRDIISEDVIRPWNILAITFTNKAAGELKERLQRMLGEEGNDILAATFHSLCVRILRREIDRLGYSKSFTIYDSDDSQRVIKSCLSDLNISDKLFPPKSILSNISRLKDQLKTPEEFENEVHGDYRKMSIAKVYSLYQKKLFNASAVDFDDIICLTVKLLENFPEVREYYQKRYKYIMVDEYQDTNHAQFRLVTLLSQAHQNLCVVGDDDQSIYKFRGATIENILSFEEQFENCAVIRLEQNYRSTQNILDAANSVIKNNNGRKSKNLWTSSGEGNKITVYKASNEATESKFVSDKILENIKSGKKFSDHAILYRMNAQSQSLERIFVQSGIPYKIIGGLKFFDRKEVKDVVAYLSVINNPNDMLRLKRIINEPKRGLGDATVSALEEISENLNINPIEIMISSDSYPMLSKKSKTLYELAEMFKDLQEISENNSLEALFDEVLDRTGYLEYLNKLGDEGITRIENINELKSTIINYSKETEEPSLSGFLEEIALYTDVDKLSDDDDRVIMMTMHSAKGLEFPEVFVVGTEEGIFPGYRSMDSEEDMEEERRLAYVAITRAKENLYITHAFQRMLFGKTNINRPSRFISEIDKDLVERIDSTVSTTKVNPGDVAPKNGSGYSLQKVLSEKKSSPQAKNAVSFSVGDRVKHNIFGEGTVLSVNVMSNDSMLEVAFDTKGTKKLMANFAKIIKI